MDIDVFPPFTIHEAEFALYLADVDGRTDGVSVFLGGRIEDLAPEVSYTKLRIDRHGDPFGRIYHSDEEHRFTVKNLWVMNRSGSSYGGSPGQTMPRVIRNQQYVFVIRWFDSEVGTWALRTYYGVTADGHALVQNDQVYHQDVPFSARRMTERSGLSSPPDLSAVTTGSLRYVSTTETRDIYSYDFNSGLFTVIDPAALTGRAQIVVDASKWELQIEGTPAFRVTSSGVVVNELSAIGGTFLLGTVYPRVEFWIGPSRIAAIGKSGELALPEWEETDTEPSLSLPAFRILVNANWAASFAQGKGYSPSFVETLT